MRSIHLRTVSRLITKVAPVAFALCQFSNRTVAQSLPNFDHIIVVVEENHTYGQVIGNFGAAPYINSLAAGGASFTNAFGIEHPSQPNYLDLFSGSNQGVNGNVTSPNAPFSTTNLAASLISSGRTFTGYSESLPFAGFTGDSFTTNGAQNQYVRKHNPWVNWQDDSLPINRLASSINQPFTAFPSDFNLLPTVAFVAPNQQNDMHDGSINAADAWLNSNIGAYASWASLHNSLLMLVWDEDNNTDNNHVPLVMFGANIHPGLYGEHVNHFDILRTVEDIYGLPYAGASSGATTIRDVFVPEPGSISLGLIGGSVGLLLLFHRRNLRRKRV